jgi:hypothetical protein
LEGFWGIVDAVAFDMIDFPLLAFRCGAEGSRFANCEGCGAFCRCEVESGGDELILF